MIDRFKRLKIASKLWMHGGICDAVVYQELLVLLSVRERLGNLKPLKPDGFIHPGKRSDTMILGDG